MHTPLADAAYADDGARIGYHSLGSGPGLVVVHGAMQSAGTHRDLAEILSGTCRVHLVDRRGRGASDAYPLRAGTAVEVGDLRAVLEATRARGVLGVSSGAIIAARTAADHPALIERLALFEPPLSINGSMRLEFGPRLDAAVDAGQLPKVAAIAMRMSEMGPPWMFRLPLPFLAAASRLMLASEEQRVLACALPVDVRIVRENADRLHDFARITARTLLISGTATRPYLRRAVAALAETMPAAEHVELRDQRHAATQNRAEHGRPDVVAPVVARFFR